MAKLKNNQRKLLYITVGILIVFGISSFVYYQGRPDLSEKNISQATGEELNLDPPTDEEKAAAVENKNNIDQRDEIVRNNEPAVGSKRSIKPVITSAIQEGQAVQVSSYVPGIFEDNGECEAVFTKNGNQVTKKVTAVKEGSAVYCPLLSAESTEFGEKGLWAVTVKYHSSSAEGKSDEYKLEVK